MEQQVLLETLEQLRDRLERDDWTGAAALIEAMRPSDQAHVFGELEPGQQQELLPQLDISDSADILEKLEDEEAAELAEILDVTTLAHIVDEMEPDEAADLLGDLEPDQAARVLKGMTAPQEVVSLLAHEDETAGGLMTPPEITLRRTMTVAEAIAHVREIHPESETVYYLFVVDRFDRLCGVVNLRQLIVADPDALIGDIMDPDVIYVEVGADQEECARLIAWYDLLALPVVDHDMRLLGVITVDDLVDVLEEEATEDMLRLSGSVGEPEERDPLLVQAAKRLPWLLVAIFGEMITANVMMGFEIILSRIVALAFFIPVIMATAGNVGSQSLAGMVRSIALGEADVRDVAVILWREARVGVMLGLICGLVVGLLARLWGQQPMLGMVVGTAMAIALVIAAALGVLIPLVLQWLKRDPAYASGPFISAINDVTSITIYFLLATLLMEQVG